MKSSSLFRFLFSTLLVCTAAAAATLDWEQQQEVTDRQAKRWAEFGRAVAVYENTLVVGAYGAERSGSDSNTEAGSVTIFDYDHQSASWKAVQKLQASDAVPGDYFGDSVALQDGTLVVGAWGRDGYKGKVYIFTLRENGEWKETQRLVAPVSEIYADFGRSVDIDGDTIVVGEPWANDGNTNQFMGAAHVYVRFNSTVWDLQAELVASYGEKDNNGFGWDVAISGNTLVVGAPPYPDAGYAVVFERYGSAWDQGFKLKASDGFENDDFGRSVDISEDTIVISSRDAAYVYERTNSANTPWVEKQILVSGGYYVAVAGDSLLYDRTYYQRDDSTQWTEQDVFGTGETTSLAIQGTTVVVGDRLANGLTGKASVYVNSDSDAFTGRSSAFAIPDSSSRWVGTVALLLAMMLCY